MSSRGRPGENSTAARCVILRQRQPPESTARWTSMQTREVARVGVPALDAVPGGGCESPRPPHEAGVSRPQLEPAAGVVAGSSGEHRPAGRAVFACARWLRRRGSRAPGFGGERLGKGMVGAGATRAHRADDAELISLRTGEVSSVNDYDVAVMNLPRRRPGRSHICGCRPGTGEGRCLERRRARRLLVAGGHAPKVACPRR
jgi:hypothetical protein